MHSRKLTISIATVLIMPLMLLFATAAHSESESTESSLTRRFLITEIKLGTGSSDSAETVKEYVMITNASDNEEVPVGLKLEYLKALETNDENEENIETLRAERQKVCNLFPWPETTLRGDYRIDNIAYDEPLDPGGSLMIENPGLTDKRGGTLRLTEETDGTLIYHDLVGWSYSNSLSNCYQQQPIEIDSDSVATRLQHFNHDFFDTDHNSADFRPEFGPLVDVCANLEDLQLEAPADFSVNELGECIEDVEPAVTQCDQVRINEILPNPDGSDGGNEFVELFNPGNEPVVLDGCSLQIDGDELLLDGVELKSNGYLLLQNNEHDFTLPNAAGGTVYLLSPTDEIESVAYQPDLEDDQVYARFNNAPQWRASYSPTPGTENKYEQYLPCPAGQFRNTDTNYCNNVVESTSNELEDCGPGRYRSPETNRCRQVESANQLVPCSADQYRSPETNRCRSVAAATSTLKPCAADQYRNPATNRCKKLETTTELADCGEGRERNPETNRCRAVATVAGASSTGSTTTSTQTDEDSPAPSAVNLPLVATAATAAVGYGLFEYRQDAKAWLWRVKQRFSS